MRFNVAEVFMEALREPMFLLLLVCAVAYFALGEWAEAVFLLCFVVLLLLLTLWQAIRTGQALQALRDLQVPMADVQRNGRIERIRASSLVPGDILVLTPGDRVAADALLLDGHVTVDESLFTGESVAAEKYPDVRVIHYALGIAGQNTAATSTLRAGTFVMRGNARATVLRVGQASALGQLERLVASTADQPTALQQSGRRLVRWFGLGALGLSVLAGMVAYVWHGQTPMAALLTGLTVGMAGVPEEIPVIMTVFTAMGAWRMAQAQVLTRHLGAVEALGRVSCVAVDKTGTLTENRMRLVAAALAPDRLWFAEASEGHADLAALRELMAAAVKSTPPSSVDAIDKSVFDLAQTLGGSLVDRVLGPASDKGPDSAVRLLEMSAAWPVMGQIHSTEQGHFELSCKGAPECVLTLCDLSTDQLAAWNTTLNGMASRGWRVLAVARARLPAGLWLNANADGWQGVRQVCDKRFILLGLLAFFDPPRPSAHHAVKALHQAGIRTMMLTGDHPVTALAVAHAIGLSQSGSALSGSDMDAMNDEQLAIALRNSDVCARMTPAQKLRVIAALQAAGHVVAMTGDGVNDAPALKAADVGVAMGARGCDLARETADVVLLDDNFAHMVQAVAQGRQIFSKIHKTSRFVLAVHVPLLLAVVLPGLMNAPALLLPAHVVLFEMLINPACSVVFEAESGDPALMRRAPLPKGSSPFGRTVLVLGLIQGAVLTLSALPALLVLVALGAPLELLRGFALLVLTLFVVQMGLSSLPSDPMRHRPRVWWWFVGGVSGLLLLAFIWPLALELLQMRRPDGPVLLGLLSVALFSAAGLRWVEGFRDILSYHPGTTMKKQ